VSQRGNGIGGEIQPSAWDQEFFLFLFLRTETTAKTIPPTINKHRHGSTTAAAITKSSDIPIPFIF
jgi:hypothetical protein